MRFLHVADIHLGYQQYNSKERFNDFGQAFLHVINEAVQQRVDFVLLAGDFFEKRTVDPLAMHQAVHGLQRLHDAGIPILAVEGNHERAHYRDQYSWLEFLDSLGLITLLDLPVQDGHLLLEPYTPEQRGAYVDLPGGVRVYGIKYYGASTDRVLELFGQALTALDGPRPSYSILLTHAGLEGILPRCSGAISREAVAPLRDRINYLALGHIHKNYNIEGWIFNPGSLETWAMDEVEWSERGYYAVELRARSAMGHQARLVPTPRRRFIRERLSVETCLTPEAVYKAVQSRLDALRLTATEERPVVEFVLEGTLSFDRVQLDVSHIEGLIRQAINPLIARVQNATAPAGVDVNVCEGATRSEVEQQVLYELIERDARFRPAAAEWTHVALALKRMALEGNSPDTILGYLRHARADLVGER